MGWNQTFPFVVVLKVVFMSCLSYVSSNSQAKDFVCYPSSRQCFLIHYP